MTPVAFHTSIYSPRRNQPANTKSRSRNKKDHDTGNGDRIDVNTKLLIIIREASKYREQQEAEGENSTAVEEDGPSTHSVDQKPGERHKNEV